MIIIIIIIMHNNDNNEHYTLHITDCCYYGVHYTDRSDNDDVDDHTEFVATKHMFQCSIHSVV